MNNYIKLLRIHQYIKNLFIFLPLFFAFKILELNLLLNCFIAFIGFCFVASSVYIFNDLLDIESDKKHPLKKLRPLASNKISIKSAIIILFIFLFTGLLIFFILNIKSFFVILIYILINVLYTIKIKHISIFDIFFISLGFLIRIFIGGIVTNIPLSMWIVLMTFLLSLFLSLAKRRDDIIIFYESGEKIRKSINGYNLQTLDASMILMASVTIVSYIMYTVSPDIINRFHSDKLYLTVVFVIFGIIRYFDIAFVHKKSGSPTLVLLKDKIIQICVLGWFISFVIIIYVI